MGILSGQSKEFRHNIKWMWPPICSPQAQLNFWVRLAHTRFAKRFKRDLREFRLIASEWAALRELYRPGRLSPVDIGRAIGMTKGGASKLVNRLVKKRLVIKEVGTYDRRFRTVQITLEGKYLVGFFGSREKTAEEEFFRFMQPDEQRQLLERLRQSLGADGTDSEYSNSWITLDGKKGQWRSQIEWRSSFRRPPSGSAAAFSRSQ